MVPSHPCFVCETQLLVLHKLNNYGISGKANPWTADFFRCCSQQVGIEGCISRTVPARSGVPQGSMLGLGLFLVAGVYKRHSWWNIFSCEQMANGIPSFQMQDPIHITRPPKPLLTTYNLYGQQIEAANSAKESKSTFSDSEPSTSEQLYSPDLYWNNNVHNVHNKASTAMRFLQRNIHISYPDHNTGLQDMSDHSSSTRPQSGSHTPNRISSM